MEVHPPHEPIHSWRDFLLHLVTITIGLLIALGLEALVERQHHRHLVEVARENIRHEMESNEAEGRKDLQYIREDAKSMKVNVDIVRSLRDDPKNFHQDKIASNFSWSSFNESAWESARDSGALTYMPADEVQRYADVYAQQHIVNEQAVAIFAKQTEAIAPLMMEKELTAVKPEDLHALMLGFAQSYVRLTTLLQLVEQLEKQYGDTLKK